MQILGYLRQIPPHLSRSEFKKKGNLIPRRSKWSVKCSSALSSAVWMENCSAGTWTDPCLYWDAGRRRVHRSAAPPDTPAYRIYLPEPIWPAWCWEEATWPDRDRNPANTHKHTGSARAYLSDEACVLRYVRSDIMLCVNRWSGVNHTHFKGSLTHSHRYLVLDESVDAL